MFALIHSFPGGASGKEPASQCRHVRDVGSNHGSRRSPRRRKWQNTPVFFFLFMFFLSFLLKDKLLYGILLFSVKPQHESAIGIHISPPFWTSISSPSPSHPSRLIQRPCLSFLSHRVNSHWLSILHMVM